LQCEIDNAPTRTFVDVVERRSRFIDEVQHRQSAFGARLLGGRSQAGVAPEESHFKRVALERSKKGRRHNQAPLYSKGENSPYFPLWS
jgi:hypothetical protein